MAKIKIAQFSLLEPVGRPQSIEELRDTFVREGYIYLKKILPPNLILNARRVCLFFCEKEGLFAEGNKRDEAEVNLRISKEKRERLSLRILRQWRNTPEYAALWENRRIIKILEALAQGPVIDHPRRMAKWGRLLPPGSLGMLPHRDFDYVGAPRETLSVWIPIGDVPLELGGIALKPGSHKVRYKKPSPYPQLKPSKKWFTADFEGGDVLIFHSQLIHGTLINQTRNKLRIAMDFRYCPRRSFSATQIADNTFGFL